MNEWELWVSSRGGIETTSEPKPRGGCTTIYRCIFDYGREAQCWQCGKRTFSHPKLPYFRFDEIGKNDEYYCGCWGWG